jgi:molybdenum cofactor biosynthesis enzyme MoaA
MLPFASINIHATGKIVRCQMSEDAMGDVVNGSIVQQWNNDAFQALRQDQIDGNWNIGCTNCLRKESDGIKSKRLHWQTLGVVKDTWDSKDFKSSIVNNDIIHMDIAFNNICNFKCRMCSSAYSNAWIADEKKLKAAGLAGGSSGTNLPKLATTYNREKNQVTAKQLTELLDAAPNLQRVEILGGEPFLVPEFMAFLDDMRSRGIHKNVELMVTTNGSVITEEKLDKLLGFKYVNINFSLDATDELFSYMRSAGAFTFEQIDKQLDIVLAWANNASATGQGVYKVNINGAYQIYNMLNLNDFIEYIVMKFKWNETTPVENSKNRHSFEHRIVLNKRLAAKSAPSGLKLESNAQLDYLVSKYPFLLEIAEKSYISDIKKICQDTIEQDTMYYDNMKFVRFTRELDKIRNVSIDDVAPDIIRHFLHISDEPVAYCDELAANMTESQFSDMQHFINWRRFYIRNLYRALHEYKVFNLLSIEYDKDMPYDDAYYVSKILEVRNTISMLSNDANDDTRHTIKTLFDSEFYRMYYVIPDKLQVLADTIGKKILE